MFTVEQINQENSQLHLIMEMAAMKVPDHYPHVNVPATTKDLKNVFDWANKKYFSNSLPKTRLKFASLAKNYMGKAHVKWGDEYKIKDLLITIASMAKNDPKVFVDTLLHEAIHIFQFKMSSKDKGKGGWLETTWAEIFASNDKHTYGHNKYFHQYADKMNRDGFNVTITADGQVEVDLTEEFYGVTFYNNSDSVIMLFCKDNPKDKIEQIIASVIERVGAGFFTRYEIFKTKDTNVLQGTRITKSWELPKNVINIQFAKKYVDKLVMNSKLTKVFSKEVIPEDQQTNPTANKQVPNEIVQTVQRVHKYRGSSFDAYAQTVYFNAFSELRKIPGNELGYWKYEGVKFPEKINKETAEYIHKDWMAISDIEIKRGDGFKLALTTVKRALSFDKGVLDSKGKERLKYEYEKNFKNRIDIKKYSKLLINFLVSKMVAEAKKRKSDLNAIDIQNVLEKKILKGVF